MEHRDKFTRVVGASDDNPVLHCNPLAGELIQFSRARFRGPNGGHSRTVPKDGSDTPYDAPHG